jgi:plastocyanin
MPRVTRVRLLRLALVAVASFALPAGVALAADQSVDIQNLAFNPSTVTVNVGDTVTWTNNDSVPHTATADDNSFDTGNIDPGTSDSVTFTSAGSFPYSCTIHPTMRGTVVVRSSVGGGGVPGTDTVSPGDDISNGPALPVFLLAAAAGALVGCRLLRRRMRAD